MNFIKNTYDWEKKHFLLTKKAEKSEWTFWTETSSHEFNLPCAEQISRVGLTGLGGPGNHSTEQPSHQKIITTLEIQNTTRMHSFTT
jgi:hypothetical protein